MSLDYYFYAEFQQDGAWERLDAPTATGYLGWLSPRDLRCQLFFDDDSLFPFTPGRPQGWQQSALWRDLLQRGYDPAYDHEHRIAWIEAEDLMLPIWEQSEVLIEQKVPACLAARFEDGRSPYPQAAITEALTQLELDRATTPARLDDLRWELDNWLRRGRLTEQAIDHRAGAMVYRRKQLPMMATIEVSWSITLAELLPWMLTLRQPADGARLMVYYA